jgi:hypothetical protein
MNHAHLKVLCVVLVSIMSVVGCRGRRCANLFYQEPPTPDTLGTHVDSHMRIQEENAEASKFVVYQHEFQLNKGEAGDVLDGLRLNEEGEDHVRQIAGNLRQVVPCQVVVERSRTSERADTRYGYPVHYNAQLDNRRRMVVVNALVAMGIENADELVVVSPAYAEGLTGREAERAYRRGLNAFNRNGSGSNGRFGGFGGGGRGGFGR